jgi:hypothetical protein
MPNRKPPAKKPPAKKEPTLRERATALYQRVSTALNPRTYAEEPAQQHMREWNEGYGGGARRREIDRQVNEATGEKPRRR